MSETSWQRLYRIAEARRERLGITRNGLKGLGGPSSEWVRKLREQEGAPSSRHRPSLDALDHALGWEAGTSWGLLADDYSAWSPDALEDEEESLIHGPSLSGVENELRDFETMVLARLRTMSPEDAAEAMRQIARILGIA